MENVAPPLVLISYIKKVIESGKSPREGIILYLSEENDEFSENVRKWFVDREQGKNSLQISNLKISSHRRSLLQLLQRGLDKESIYQQLLLLENETMEACYQEINEKMTKLPYLMMVPVLFFQFPALILLILGPLIQNFVESLQ